MLYFLIQFVPLQTQNVISLLKERLLGPIAQSVRAPDS